MNRGEVWSADIVGLGRRPVLIMTRDVAVPLLRNIVVATITRRVRGVPTEVALDERDGLDGPSVVSFDNIRTISKDVLVARMGTLSPGRLDEVCEAFRYAVGCD
jgi:mRNA interferase MazF